MRPSNEQKTLNETEFYISTDHIKYNKSRTNKEDRQ